MVYTYVYTHQCAAVYAGLVCVCARVCDISRSPFAARCACLAQTDSAGTIRRPFLSVLYVRAVSRRAHRQLRRARLRCSGHGRSQPSPELHTPRLRSVGFRATLLQSLFFFFFCFFVLYMLVRCFRIRPLSTIAAVIVSRPMASAR